ncbi:SRPBCC domain-containing protein [Candidatus Bipolaricaulota bacterium]|nr:SRPBCC domain-containing protein [Candidatus Bipolaricaulota bacterium]
MERVQHHTVELKCNLHEAYEMFTLNKNLEKWLTAKADVEPTLGGKYELFWNPPERETDSNINCRITVFVPDVVLGFEWKGPLEDHEVMNSVDPLTHVSVFFLPQPRGKEQWTAIHLVHSGWRSTAEWESPWEFFQKAWRMVFERLAQLVNEGAVPPPWSRRPAAESF